MILKVYNFDCFKKYCFFVTYSKNHPFKCTVPRVLKNIQLCNPHHDQHTEQLHPLPNPHAPCSTPPLYPISGNYWSVFCPYHFVSSRMSQKCNHTVHRLLSEASFPEQYASGVHPCALCISVGSICCCVVFRCVNEPLFIYSPAEGPLGCFQVWMVMNKAATNIH